MNASICLIVSLLLGYASATDVSMDPKEHTYYYCKGTDDVLYIQCKVVRGTVLVWNVSPSVPFTTPVTLFSLIPNETIFHRGPFSILLESIDLDVKETENNITSSLWFNTADIDGDIVVSCESGGESDSMEIISTGVPDPPYSVNATSILLDGDDHYFIFIKWNFNTTSPELPFGVSKIFVNGIMKHQMRTQEGVQNSSCNVTREGADNFTIEVSAAGHCGTSASVKSVPFQESEEPDLKVEVVEKSKFSTVDIVAIIVPVSVVVVLAILGLLITVCCIRHYMVCRVHPIDLTKKDEPTVMRLAPFLGVENSCSEIQNDPRIRTETAAGVNPRILATPAPPLVYSDKEPVACIKVMDPKQPNLLQLQLKSAPQLAHVWKSKINRREMLLYWKEDKKDFG